MNLYLTNNKKIFTLKSKYISINLEICIPIFLYFLAISLYFVSLHEMYKISFLNIIIFYLY